MVEKLSRVPNVLLVGICTILGFAIFLTINLLIFRNLPISEFGILKYEFAWSVEKVQLIFADWGIQGMEAQAAGVWWDFLYIIGYSLCIGGCILLVTRMNEGRIHTIGLYVTLTPFLAGLLDVIENIFLLKSSNQRIRIMDGFFRSMM